jgi:serine protease Do
MEMKKWYWAALIPLAFILIVTFSPALSPAQSASPLKQVDEAFVQIAKKVSPAVVNISSEKKMARTTEGQEMEPFFRQFPFREFFGDDFFKHFKELPRGEGGPAPMALGSGVIVSPDGIILTNAHVVKDMREITVTLTDKRSFKAKLLGADPESDIAVIKIDAKDLPVAALGDSNKLRVGEVVLAIGNPFGLTGTVTSGIVSATGRTNVGITGYEDFIQTDAAINPGNSGGPLVNINGEVIGINTAIATRSGGYQGIGFAIPSDSAKLIMDQLVKEGKVHRGLLGVNIQDLNQALAKSFGRTDTNGALVSEVVPGSPAEKGGIKAGDIVLSFNGHPVTGAGQLKNLVGLEKPGSTVKMTIYRDHKTQEIAATVGERTPQALASVSPKAETSKELGMELEKVPAQVAKKMKIKEGVGLMIKSVDPEGLGSRMGLEAGDVILDIDGHKVADVSQFSKEVDQAKKNGVIRLMVQRGSATLYLADSIG